MKNKLLLFLILIMPILLFGQTPCLDAVANATGLIGEFIPQCEEDGSYSPTQCWGSTGYCWCVDIDGIEIPGTAIPAWQGVPNCNENLCQGVSVAIQNFNNSTIDIIISTENSPDFWCSYCGLVLLDTEGNIVAIENPYDGGSFYGLAGGSSEIRTLDIIANIDLPFEGQLDAMYGLMPNILVDKNFNIDPENPVDMENGDIPFTMCTWPFSITNSTITHFPSFLNKRLVGKIDVLGRQKVQKGLQLEIYNDGSVEKKYFIK